MKLTAIILLSACLAASANGHSQNVTLTLKDAPLEKVFTEIKKQTGYTFVYKTEALTQSRKVDITVSNASLQQALDLCFKGQPLTYKIFQRVIAVKSKDDPTNLTDDNLLPPPIDVKGRILNENGEPVIATITEKGTKNAASSDANGYFELKNVNENARLVISGVNIETYEIKVEGKTDLATITVKIQVKEGEVVQIVSTGYENIPKERATGSFEQVTEKQLNQQFSTGILDRLQSVSTILFDNKPNLQLRPQTVIRGVSSINGPTDPLIILDNFPYDGNINTINPNMIESVTILRDAAAASIWGARAGNGVIVITTKKGKYNRPLQIDLTVNTSVITKPDLFSIPVVNSSEIIDFEKWLFSNGYRFSDTANTNRPRFSPVYEILFKQRRGTISQQEAEEQLNKLKVIDVRGDYNKYMYRPAINKQYALSASGGSEKISYRFSGGYDQNISNLASNYQRFSFRAENRYKITNKVTATAVFSYTNTFDQSGRSAYSSTTEVLYLGLVDPEGNEIPRYRYRQPYLDTAGQGKLLDWKYYPLSDYKHDITETKSDHLLTNFVLQYQILKSLQISANYQLESQKSLAISHRGLESYYTRDLINKFSQINSTTGVVTYMVPKGDIVDRNYRNLNSRNLRTQLNFTKETSSYTINSIGGWEIRERKDIDNSYRIYGFDPNSASFSDVNYGNTFPNYITRSAERIPSNLSETDKNIRYVSLFANAGFTYLKKYGVTVSARRDASNLFGVETNQKWTPQWSAGASWSISDEKFFSKNIFQLLKLRASYGTSGNVDQRKSGVTTIRYTSASVAGFSQALINQYPNPSLRWETMSMANIGVEFSMLNNLLNGGIEFYAKKSTDLFGTAPLDYTTGIFSLARNIASTKGRGFDLFLNSQIIASEIKWNISLLLSYAKTEVTKYDLASDAGVNNVSNGNSINPLVGKPVYVILSYPWAGLDAQGNPQSIVAGQPSINYATITTTSGQVKVADLIYSGPAIAPVYGSITNTLTYKNLEFNFNLNYKLGYYFRRESVSYNQFIQNGITHTDYLKRWQNPGDELITTVPSLQYPINNQRDAFYSNSAILATKGDHLRLKFINLSYNVNNRTLKKNPFKYIQVTLNASNLGVIWRSNKYGIDPEYPELQPGKQFSLGIRAGF